MLSRVLPLFSARLETGVDLLWCRVLDEARYKFAVIDTVSVRHTRAVGQQRADQGFIGENSEYQTVINKMELQTGVVVFKGPVAYAAVLRNGWRAEGSLEVGRHLTGYPLLD